MNAVPRRVVVTGTDTEIGKTLVAAGIARALSDAGIAVRALKPVESGATAIAAGESDGAVLASAARQNEPKEAFVRLRAPLAPPVAADLEGISLDMEAWCRWVEDSAADADVVLVEGAGGVLSPLTWCESSRELAVKLGAAALLVAPDRLGVLTHTLTAMESLEASGVPLAGVVYSTPETADSSTGHNADALRRFAELDRVAALPRVGSFEEAAAHLGPVVRWILDGPAPAPPLRGAPARGDSAADGPVLT